VQPSANSGALGGEYFNNCNARIRRNNHGTNEGRYRNADNCHGQPFPLFDRPVMTGGSIRTAGLLLQAMKVATRWD